MIIEWLLKTKCSNINAVNFLPEKIMYRHQNLREDMNETSRSFVLFCCKFLLTLDDFDFFKLLQNGRLKNMGFSPYKELIVHNVCSDFAGLLLFNNPCNICIQTFSFVFQEFVIHPRNTNPFNIFTWGKIR